MSAHYASSEQVLMLASLEQTSKEQSTTNEIRKLIVRSFTDAFYLMTDSYLTKAYCRNIPCAAAGMIVESFRQNAYLTGQ